MHLLCTELREAESFLQSMAQKSVRERLAEVILILKKKYGADAGPAQKLNIELSREDIANLVGTATETVIRLLSELKDEKTVALEGRSLAILNHKKLIEIAKVDD
jgi:CRP/FNR family transcriptional regulator